MSESSVGQLGDRMSYDDTLVWLRRGHVTFDKALDMRDLPESRLDEAALRAYLRQAPVEFRR